MTIVSINSKPKFKTKSSNSSSKELMSLKRFLNSPKKEDGYKYELVNGNLEKSYHNMTTNELKIVKIIRRKFLQTSFFTNGGEMEAETKIVLTQNPDKVRIPDLAFFTKEQIETASETNFPIPEFAIELISANDGMYRGEKKILEYFEAGMKVVWLVYPEIKQVKVYTSPKNVTICFDNDAFDAAPVIPDLKMTVDELFG